MKRLITFLALAVTLSAQILPYDADRRIPYEGGGGIDVALWHWQAAADSHPIYLFVNGTYAPQYDEPEGIANIRLSDAWSIQPDACGVSVAVIDTGRHGDFVSSVVELVAPGVDLVRLESNYSDASVAAAIGSSTAPIFNLSFGLRAPAALTVAAIAAHPERLFICAAASNSSPDILSDIGLPNVIVVGSFAHSGSFYQTDTGARVNVFAPGRRVLVESAGQLYSASGTSYAAPHVAGVAALLWARHPEWTAAQVKSAVIFGSEDRRLNAWASLYWNGKSTSKLPLNLDAGTWQIESTTDLISWKNETIFIGPGTYKTPVGVEDYRFWRGRLVTE